jgi:hypothetical protein
MTQISFWQPAGTYAVPGKGEFPEKFMPRAFDRAIGKQVPMTGPGGEDLGLCTLVAAEVAEDGSGVTLTVELPPAAARLSPAAQGMSFAAKPPKFGIGAGRETTEDNDG